MIINNSLVLSDNRKTWIKITCFGPTVPLAQNYPSKLKIDDLESFYFPITSKFSIPNSLEDIRDQNFERFSSINDRCHSIRFQKTDISNLQNGKKFLDWNTDYMYAGLKFFIEYSQVGICQNLHGPCLNNLDCCNKKSSKVVNGINQLYCDNISQSCEYQLSYPDKKKDSIDQN